MLRFTASPPIHILFENHTSSRLDPEFISNGILSEQAAGCYATGFQPEALEAVIGPFQTSPMGLIPKPHSDSLRLVQDMLFPWNDPLTPSINTDMNLDNFPTAWGMFESTALLILSLPEGCLAATFDISTAYHLTLLCPDQQNTLCIFWNGMVYVGQAIMFGLTSSVGVFGSVTDMLVAIYRKAGFEALQKWVDNFLVIWLPHETWTEKDFTDLTQAIGVPWSHKKTCPQAPVQHYIGFIIIQDWHGHQQPVGHMALGAQSQGWSQTDL
jgi:hypothetical protein